MEIETKTLLTQYELYLYGSYYLETEPRLLCSGTTNQIIQWRKKYGFETDKGVRKHYGRSCYTVVYRKEIEMPNIQEYYIEKQRRRDEPAWVAGKAFVVVWGIAIGIVVLAMRGCYEVAF